MLGQDLEDFVGDDQVPEVVGVDAVVVDHPRRAIVGGEEVDVEAIFVARDGGNAVVLVVEEFEVGVGPMGLIDGEVGHEVGPGQNDERIDSGADGVDEGS